MVFDWHDPVSAATHLAWAIIAIPAWYYLVKYKKDKFPLSIFMFTMELCYFSSFLFHATPNPICCLCDHICIFLLMAGTYTPIVWKYCIRSRVRTLSWVWGLALSGIFILLVTRQPIIFVYIAMGWGMILASYDLLSLLFRKEFLWILAGGMFYTVGAVLEFLAVPTIIPHWVEHHEVWHLFVMAGTTCHYVFMWRQFTNGRPKVCNKVS